MEKVKTECTVGVETGMDGKEKMGTDDLNEK